MDLPNRLLPALIGALAILLPAPRRGAALAGAVITALALASLQVAGGRQWLDAGLAPTYLAITAALLAFGVLLALRASLFPAWDDWPRARVNVSLLVLALGGYAVTLVAKAGGPLLSLGVLASLVAIVAGLWLVVRFAGISGWIERVRARRAERLAPVGDEKPDARKYALLGTHLLGAVLAVIGPHLVVVVVGVVLAAVSGWLIGRRAEARRRPWGLATGVVLLTLVTAALIQVAGETPLGLWALRNGPFSPAFEPLAALGFLLAAWPLLRFWPFHYEELGALTPFAAGMLLARVAGPVLPLGLGHWQPLIFPLLVLLTWGALVTGDWAQGARALGAAGVITLIGGGPLAGGLLLAGEGLLVLAAQWLPARARGPVSGLLLLGMVPQLVPVLEAGLRTQTFYTVLLAASLALMLVNATPAPERRPAR